MISKEVRLLNSLIKQYNKKLYLPGHTKFEYLIRGRTEKLKNKVFLHQNNFRFPVKNLL